MRKSQGKYMHVNLHTDLSLSHISRQHVHLHHQLITRDPGFSHQETRANNNQQVACLACYWREKRHFVMAPNTICRCTTPTKSSQKVTTRRMGDPRAVWFN